MNRADLITHRDALRAALAVAESESKARAERPNLEAGDDFSAHQLLQRPGPSAPQLLADSIQPVQELVLVTIKERLNRDVAARMQSMKDDYSAVAATREVERVPAVKSLRRLVARWRTQPLESYTSEDAKLALEIVEERLADAGTAES